MKIKKICILLLPLFLALQSFAQENGYRITFDIDGYNDTLAYLGYYYGDKLSVADTSIADRGHIVFEGPAPLKQGVYFLVSGKKARMFEFMVGGDQEFSLSNKADGTPDDMKIRGSEENKLFYDYLINNRKSYDVITELQARLKALPEDNDSLPIIKQEIEKLNQESVDYKLRLMEENPGSLTTLLFNVMKEPEVPDFFSDGGRQDTLNYYLYYRNHYWDGVDFSDDRILRTPVFHRKMERYMEQVLPKHPDTLINEIDKMIASTGENSDLRQYLLWYFTNTYETSNIMGYDKIFVHMVDEYFTDVSYDWLTPSVQKSMTDRVNKMRGVLIGEFAPSLIMADTSGNFISLHQQEAEYIIVLFWTSTCGECKREVNKLKAFYNESTLDLKIFAVNTDTVFSDWKKYVREKGLDWINVNGNISLSGDYHETYDVFSTPTIYVLDNEKRIIAKRLSASKIPDFLYRRKNN